MRKLLSTAVVASMIAAAGSAQAVTVYEKDGLTFKIKGDWQIQLRQDIGDDQDVDVEYDDLEIKNSVSYDISDKFTAFGQLDFGFKNAADKSDNDDDPDLEEAYIGFGYDKFKGLIGKTDSAGDEFGVQGSIETVVADDVFDEVGAVDGDDLILIKADFDMVYVVASHELSADSEKSSGNGEFTDIFVGFEYAGFEVGTAYQNYEAKGADAIDLFGISLGYNFDKFYIGVDYSDAEDSQSIWNIFGSVKVLESTTVGAGFVSQEFDTDDEDVNGWYANVVYKFPTQKKVSIFAEIGDDDVDDHDLGFLVGARIKF